MSSQGKRRVYVCHTFYHAYITCLKELHIQRDEIQKEAGAVLLLSSMSNDFGNLKQQAERAPACLSRCSHLMRRRNPFSRSLQNIIQIPEIF